MGRIAMDEAAEQHRRVLPVAAGNGGLRLIEGRRAGRRGAGSLRGDAPAAEEHKRQESTHGASL